MGNLILCDKVCDTANFNKDKQIKEKELVSNLLLKIEFLEEKLISVKDDIKDVKEDLQYDIKELKNDLITLIKFIK